MTPGESFSEAFAGVPSVGWEFRRLHIHAAALAVQGGMSVMEVHRQFNLSCSHIYRACSELRIQVGTQRRKSIAYADVNARVFHILAAIIDGKDSDADIARKYKVTSGHIASVRKQATACGVFKAVAEQRRWRNSHDEQWRIQNPLPYQVDHE